MIDELNKTDLINSLKNEYNIFKDLKNLYKISCCYLHMKPSYTAINKSFSKLENIKNPDGSLTLLNAPIVGYLRISDDKTWNPLLSFVQDCGTIMLRELGKQRIKRYLKKHELVPI